MEALTKIPKVQLWDTFTPLEPQVRLAKQIGAKSVLVKRDDCNGLAFGGNKVRQLEYYLGEALTKKADTVLMTGAVQSNFVRTAAAACCKLGLSCHIQLEDRVPKDDPEYKRSGNVLLDELFGATLHYFPEGENEEGADQNLKDIAAALTKEGKTPYIVPMHPSHPPLGALGYVEAAYELVAQFKELGGLPDEIFVPSGSGNTHGGLVYGLRSVGCNVPVTGVCVRRDASQQRPRISQRFKQIADMLGQDNPVKDSDLVLTDEFLAPQYGIAGPQAHEAIKVAARTEGLILDPVYTAKTFAALLQSAEQSPGRNLVFIHTGGGPSIFGYGEELRSHLN